jgi:hypothetical protein
MEMTQINRKNNETFNRDNGNSTKRNNDVLSPAEREILQLVSEFYIRFEGGHVKTGHKS